MKPKLRFNHLHLSLEYSIIVLGDKMQNKYYVYEWYIEDTGEIFYLGKGSNNRMTSMKDRNKIFKEILKLFILILILVYQLVVVGILLIIGKILIGIGALNQKIVYLIHH